MTFTCRGEVWLICMVPGVIYIYIYIYIYIERERERERERLYRFKGTIDVV